MDIYLAKTRLYDLNNKDLEVEKGKLVAFEDEERAETALNKELIEKVHVTVFKETTNEKEETKNPNLNNLKVDELKDIARYEDIELNGKETKKDLIDKIEAKRK